MQESFELAKKLIESGNESFFAVLCPFPGSSIYENPGSYNLIIKDQNFSNYNLTVPVMDTKNLTIKEIRKYYYYYSIELKRFSIHQKMWQLVEQAALQREVKLQEEM